jgi:hypothetical protein
MNKILLSIISLILFYNTLSAKEPTLAILRSVQMNEYQNFSIGMYHFVCRPYGVITLNELYNNSQLDSICKEGIKDFYLQNPLEKYFVLNLLKNRQLYHIRFKKKRCVVYAKGKVSLSELLIKNGLAIKDPSLDDEEFNHSFTKAQEYSKNLEIGLFKNKIMKKCILNL